MTADELRKLLQRAGNGEVVIVAPDGAELAVVAVELLNSDDLENRPDAPPIVVKVTTITLAASAKAQAQAAAVAEYEKFSRMHVLRDQALPTKPPSTKQPTKRK